MTLEQLQSLLFLVLVLLPLFATLRRWLQRSQAGSESDEPLVEHYEPMQPPPPWLVDADAPSISARPTAKRPAPPSPQRVLPAQANLTTRRRLRRSLMLSLQGRLELQRSMALLEILGPPRALRKFD